jgi:hypothetical protein
MSNSNADDGPGTTEPTDDDDVSDSEYATYRYARQRARFSQQKRGDAAVPAQVPRLARAPSGERGEDSIKKPR